MALSDFLGLTDDSLAATFAKPPFDIDRARAALSERLDKAARQFNATEPQPGRKMFSVNNSVVKLTLPFAIEGRTEFHLPSERFADAVRKLKDSIAKGELDRQLEAAGGKPDKTAAAATGRRRRAPMSDEAKAAMTAKRRATMAERGIKPGPRGSRG